MKNTFRFRMTAAVLAVMIAMSLMTGAQASKLTDLLFPPSVEVNEEINTTSISADHIFLGDSVTLYGSQNGLDESKCEYAYYLRLSLLNWEELGAYSKNNVCEWTPQKKGEYEICAKVRCNKKIYKRYFTITVSEELLNHSLISSSNIKVGETVELSGKGEGGEGDLKYGFFYKNVDETEWNCLSSYGSGDHVQWNPKVVGTYDICINVRDKADNVKKKYFTLQVNHPGVTTPSEFTITVKAPISSPYLWSCSLSDEEVLTYTVTEKGKILDTLHPYVLLEYRFQTASLGNTQIGLHYLSCDGKDQELLYDITVDKHLNFTLGEVTGHYWEETLPQPVQVMKTMSVSLINAPSGYQWKYQISDSLVADAAGNFSSSELATYSFHVYRSGQITLTFTCVSKSDMTQRYQLIYDIEIDQNMDISILHVDGFYDEDTEIPDLVVS